MSDFDPKILEWLARQKSSNQGATLGDLLSPAQKAAMSDVAYASDVSKLNAEVPKYDKLFGPRSEGYADDILAEHLKPGKTAADSAKVFEEAGSMVDDLGRKSAAESAEILAQAPKHASELAGNVMGKSAAESAEVLAKAPVLPEAVELAPNKLQKLMTELKASKAGGMVEKAAAKAAPVLEQASAKMAPVMAKVAPVVEKGAEVAGRIAASPVARGLAKVAGPVGIAADALYSADAGAGSDVPIGPALTPEQLEATAGGPVLANTDLVPPSAPKEVFGPPSPTEQQRMPADLASAKIKQKTVKETRGAAAAQAPKAAEEPAEEPVEETEEGYQLGTLERLQAAQKSQNMLNLMAGLSDTGTDFLNNTKAIGDMFTNKPSSVQYSKDTGAHLRKQGEKVVTDHKDSVENQKNDPKSQMSVEMRALFKKMGFPVGPNVSAADIEKKFPGVSNIYTQKEAQKARKEQYEFQAAENAKQRQLQRESNELIASMRREDKKDAKTNDYLVKAAERINRFEQTDDVKALRGTQSAAAILDSAIAEKDPNKRRGLLGPAMMMFGKIAQGDSSVLREGDQKILTSNYGLNGDLIDKVAAAARGEKGLSDNDLRNMQRVIQGVAELKKSYVAGQIEKEKQLGQKLYPGMTYEGLFNPDTLRAIDYDETGNKVVKPAAPAQTQMRQAPATNPGEVERLDKKTGKIAIFDAQTKQFIRYK